MNAQKHDEHTEGQQSEVPTVVPRRVTPDHSAFDGLIEARGWWAQVVDRLSRRPTCDIVVVTAVGALVYLGRNLPSDPGTPTATVAGHVLIGAMITIIALCAMFKKEGSHGTPGEESTDPPP